MLKNISEVEITTYSFEGEVFCDSDKCSKSEYFDYESDTWGLDKNEVIEKQSEKAGWLVLDGKHYCPECGQVIKDAIQRKKEIDAVQIKLF